RPGRAIRRHPGHGRLPDVRRAGVRDRQPDRRPLLLRARSAPARVGTGGSKVTMRAPFSPFASLPQRLQWSVRRSWESDIAWSYPHSPVAIAASIVAVTLVGGAVLAPWIAPHNPFDAATLNLMEGFTPPGAPSPATGRIFLLGTDSQGRDIFSAILY